MADLMSDMGGYGGRQIPRAGEITERLSVLPFGRDAYGRVQMAMPGLMHDGLQAFSNAGDAAARGDWRGAGYAGGQAAGMAMGGGMGLPRPSGSLGMAGNPIPMSSWHGPRAAALRQRQMDEALALMRANPEKFMPGSRGAPLVDQLEYAAKSMQFGPPVKQPPAAPGGVVGFRPRSDLMGE